MSSRRQQSPPRYGYQGYPERSSTGNFHPPSSYADPYYGRYTKPQYTSPRGSHERIGSGGGGGATTLASVENYDKYGRKVSSTPGPAYESRRSSALYSSDPQRRLSLNTAAPPQRPYDPRHPAAISHAPSSATLPPRDRYDRGSGYQIPVSSASAASRSSHNRHSSSIDDAYRRPAGDDRRRDDPIPRRRESLDKYGARPPPNLRPDRLGYPPTGASKLRHDDRASYEYTSSRDRQPQPGDPRRHDRSESFDASSRERPKSLALEYPGYPKAPREAAPPVTKRGLDRMNGVQRSESLREPRSISPPSQIERGRGPSTSDNEDYHVPRRSRPQSEYLSSSAVTSPTRSRFDEDRDFARPPRPSDAEIASRGFGLRAPNAEIPRGRDVEPDRANLVPAGMTRPRSPDDDYPRPQASRHRPPPTEYDTKPRDRDVQLNRDRGESLDAPRSRDGPRDRDWDRNVPRQSMKEMVPGGHEDEDTTREGEPLVDDYEQRAQQELSARHRGGHPEHAASKHRGSEAAVAAGGGVAALAGEEAVRQHQHRDEDSDEGRRKERRERRDAHEGRREPRPSEPSEKESLPMRESEANRGERHRSEEDLGPEPEANETPEDDYQQRLQQEYQRVQSKGGAAAPSASKQPPQQNRRRERSPPDEYSPPRHSTRSRHDEGGAHRPSRDGSPSEEVGSQALARYQPPEVEPLTDEPYSYESSDMPMSPTREKRVAIVEPPKEEKKPKGILKQRSAPFPDYPDEPKVGVKPLAPVEGAAPGSDRTKLKRSAVSTKILEEYGERYDIKTKPDGEEIVEILRVLPKEVAEKYIKKTEDLRAGRHKDHRRHRDREDKDDDEEEDEERHRHRKHRHRKHKDNPEEDDRDDEDRPKQKAIEY